MKNKKSMTLTDIQLHKLLCLLDVSIIDVSAVKNKNLRKELFDFHHELSWDIAELFDYDLNEGSIDPKTLQFRKFSSRF